MLQDLSWQAVSARRATLSFHRSASTPPPPPPPPPTPPALRRSFSEPFSPLALERGTSAISSAEKFVSPTPTSRTSVSTGGGYDPTIPPMLLVFDDIEEDLRGGVIDLLNGIFEVCAHGTDLFRVLW